MGHSIQSLRATLALLAAALWGMPGVALGQAAESDSMLMRLDALEAQVLELSQSASLPPVVTLDHAVGPCTNCSIVPACESPDPIVCPGWEASAELLYLKLHQRGLDFAVSEDGTGLVFGDGQVHNLDFDRDAGFRATVGYRTKAQWAVRVAYTSLTTDGTAYAERPEGIGQLFATRSQPDGAQESNTAKAAGAVDYQLFDLFAERPMFQSRLALFSVFGGFRWIDFAQDFHYDYDGRDFTNGRIIDETRMDGFGLRMGGEGHWRWANGFSIFGNLAGGLTYGRYKTHFLEDNLDQNVLIVDARDRFEQAVASMEARAGIAWAWNAVTLRAGYEMINWFNLAERAAFVDDVQEATYVPLAQDVLLEGLFLQLTVVR